MRGVRGERKEEKSNAHCEVTGVRREGERERGRILRTLRSEFAPRLREWDCPGVGPSRRMIESSAKSRRRPAEKSAKKIESSPKSPHKSRLFPGAGDGHGELRRRRRSRRSPRDGGERGARGLARRWCRRAAARRRRHAAPPRRRPPPCRRAPPSSPPPRPRIHPRVEVVQADWLPVRRDAAGRGNAPCGRRAAATVAGALSILTDASADGKAVDAGGGAASARVSSFLLRTCTRPSTRPSTPARSSPNRPNRWGSAAAGAAPGRRRRGAPLTRRPGAACSQAS